MVCRPRRRLAGNAQGSGCRDGPRRLHEDARRQTSPRARGQRAFPATLGLHRTSRSRVRPRIAMSLQDASRVHDRGNGRRCSVALEEPGAHVEHRRPATPRGMSLAGRLGDDRHSLHHRQRWRLTLRPTWGRSLLLSGVSRRLRSDEDSLRLLHSLRLDGAHEAIRDD
jgi:hypothetical protein